MKALQLSGPADCKRYVELVHALVDDELAHEDRVRLDAHAAACPACRSRRDVEEGLGRALRARLSPAPAPDGLERRIRDALRRAEPGIAPRSSARRPGASIVAAAAAVVALAVLTVGSLRRSGEAPPLAPLAAVPVARTVTVVDLVCDAHHVPYDAQRACRQPGHVNALKLDDGSYWGIVVAGGASKGLVEDAALRGRRMSVRGTLYPAIRSIAVTEVGAPEISSRSGASPGRSAAVSARLATLPRSRRGFHPATRGDA